MKKILLFPLLFLAIAFTACDSDGDKATVLPAADLAMERTIIFHSTNEADKANYTTENFQTAFMLENQELYILFSTAVAAGKDEITFNIKQADLTEGYVGRYNLKVLPDPDAGKARVTYTYLTPGSSGSLLFSDAEFMEGKIEITEYDAKHQLISGKYDIRISNVFDPTRLYPDPAETKICDIVVTGTFKDVKLVYR